MVATLPQPRLQTAQQFPADQFRTIPAVPVFAEHETTARSGRKLRFTLAELQMIVDRCNRRIAETGDYAAITIGHTPDPSDPNKDEKQPEVVGFAGPFKIGPLGLDGQRQRYAILADFHVYRDRMTELRKFPRRSPELWLEDSYAEMFLDPIALLGAEAPRLDMGLLYSANYHNRVVEKYAAVAPGPGNTFVPTHDGPTAEKEQYAPDSEGDSMDMNQGAPDASAPAASEAPSGSLGEGEIRQIIEALEAQDWVQFVKQQMLAAQGPGEATDPAGAPEAPAADPMGPPTGAGAPPAAAPPAPPAGPPAVPPAGETESEPMQRRYQAGSGSVDGSDGNDASGTYPQAGSPSNITPEVKKMQADGNVDGAEGTPSPAPVQQYSRLQQGMIDLNEKYSRLESQLGVEREKRVNSERELEIRKMELDGVVFDVPKTIERTKYSKMNDEQFKEHKQSLYENCPHIPINGFLPSGQMPPNRTPEAHNGVERYQYSAEVSKKAMDFCMSEQAAGREADYEAALQKFGSA